MKHRVRIKQSTAETNKTKSRCRLPLALLFAALFVPTLDSAAVLAQQSGPANGQLSNGPVVAPTNTVGNTPSSVTNRSGSSSSGYSARGNTANTNLNNTQVGNRGSGVPVGNGSKTSASSSRAGSTAPSAQSSTAPSRLAAPTSTSFSSSSSATH